MNSAHSGDKKKEKDKKKKKDKGVVHLDKNGKEDSETPGPQAEKDKEPPKPHPAAVGLSPNDDYTLVPSPTLTQLITTRRQWVDQVGSVFQKRQAEDPGRIWGSPLKSVFEGIDEDVKEELEKAKKNGPPLSAKEIERAKAETARTSMDTS